jgi:DNA polymerase-1
VTILDVLPHAEIWCVDFEFQAADGERPVPVCLVALELRSCRRLRLWADELGPEPPFRTDAGALFVAYYASAELGCFLALGWPMPMRILDLFTEFRAAINGLKPPCGFGLLGALAWQGLDGIAPVEKDAGRALVLRGGPWSETEKLTVLNYCESDVVALAALLPRMLPEILARQPEPHIAFGHALLRGRYMAAVARMERTGIPIDTDMLGCIRANWDDIKVKLIEKIDARYGVYDGTTFKRNWFASWLASQGIPWPRLPSGELALDDGTFRDQGKAWPQVQLLRELRHALGELRLEALAVGRDGRNRCLLSAFRARSGRNAPSNTKFAFGPAVWLRSLIRPGPGMALAYVDFSSQEVGIAAALSADQGLIEAYRSGDVYLAFAKQAGLAPADATKASHGEIRDRCKAVVLGVQYGMQAESLARRIGRPPCEARALLDLHHATYARFWRWVEAAVTSFELTRKIQTVFGWPLWATAEWNARTVQNFPMQAHGAEMLRLACCSATERGLAVCAPVHDALLLEAPTVEIDEKVAVLRACMAEASRIVLGGFEIRTDVEIVRYPDHYADPRGKVMWATVTRLLDEAADAADRKCRACLPP